MTPNAPIFAEDAPYWRTGNSSPDKWIEMAKQEIKKADGHVTASGFGEEPHLGRAAFMIAFCLGQAEFRIVWPVLPTSDNEPATLNAAKRQAATMLHHDIKARAVSSRVLGVRRAFFAYLQLPDGRTASDLTEGQLPKLPAMLQPSQPLLTKEPTP